MGQRSNKRGVVVKIVQYIIIQCCVTDHPQTEQLTVISIDDLVVSAGQDFACILARRLWFKVSQVMK